MVGWLVGWFGLGRFGFVWFGACDLLALTLVLWFAFLVVGFCFSFVLFVLLNQSALFNFQSLLQVILLLICACAYARGFAPRLVDRLRQTPASVLWKFARIGVCVCICARACVFKTENRKEKEKRKREMSMCVREMNQVW